MYIRLFSILACPVDLDLPGRIISMHHVSFQSYHVPLSSIGDRVDDIEHTTMRNRILLQQSVCVMWLEEGSTTIVYIFQNVQATAHHQCIVTCRVFPGQIQHPLIPLFSTSHTSAPHQIILLLRHLPQPKSSFLALTCKV
jgi:hypothetical protein